MSLWCYDEDSLHSKETKASHEVFVATKPEECISVNQMASTKPRFYAQLKGKLTKKRYCCATIFVDHFSRLQYVHPQVNDSLIKTIAAKHAFESFAAKHGVRIHHYHRDNVQFADNTLKQACHAAAYLLWRKRPLSKWHRGALHP
jgi:hypothetical protein